MFALLLLPWLVAPLTPTLDDRPEGVFDTQDPADISLTPQESLERIEVPPGFHVTLFAGEPAVRRPIAFDLDDRGRLWVVENYAHPDWDAERTVDRIVILADTDQDGRYDHRTVFWDQGRYLSAIAVGHGGVWIGNTPELAFLPDRDHDDVPDGPPVVVLDGFAISKNNVLNNFHWGPDGWLYGAIGIPEPSLVGPPGTPPEQRVRLARGIWRYHPVERRFESVAQGMVNPWGADFNEYGDLFTSNTVIAHLWHIVPGMYCQIRGTHQHEAIPYDRIQSIADHLHWGGGTWQASRATDERHSVAGGGHAHCGAMVYLGDNWPEAYRGTFFTANLHGNRINNDRLVPHKSTYVGVHADDFLHAHDPWFRGLTLKYGPDGGVFVSDWHDFGECHDSDGSHRSSGRIYKVVYAQPKNLPTIDLAALGNEELVGLHTHPNEWFVRHARRILHERSVTGQDVAAARQALRARFGSSRDTQQRLRLLWTRYVMGDLSQVELGDLLLDEEEHLRRWAVRLLVDKAPPSDELATRLIALARREPSAKVRLALATAIGKCDAAHRWQLAGALAAHVEDADDPYVPLMIWYGIEPLVATQPQAALDFARDAALGTVRVLVVRRLLDTSDPPVERLIRAAIAAASEPTVRDDLVQGMFLALRHRGQLPPPPSWPRLQSQLATSDNPNVRSAAVRLATIFGDPAALTRLREVALNDALPLGDRKEALAALLPIEDAMPVLSLHRLLENGPADLRSDVLAALSMTNNGATADVLLTAYAEFSRDEQESAVGILTTRKDFALSLLAAVEQGRIPRGDISASALQQLKAFADKAIAAQVGRLWADDVDHLEKAETIAHYKHLLTPEYLATGNVSAGRQVFVRNCGRCHRLFGEGGSLGPELTGSGRKDVDYVLSNLVDPSALVDPAYRLTTVATTDGRLFSGFIVQLAETFLVIRTQQADVRLALKHVEQLQTSSVSMMPEGMLRSLGEEELRDLVIYLGSDESPPAAAAE